MIARKYKYVSLSLIASLLFYSSISCPQELRAQYILWNDDDRPKVSNLPMTGSKVPGMEHFEKDLSDFMQFWHIPGASVSIYYRGKSIYSRGFGYSDREKLELVNPDALFRIGSVSKIFTSLAVLKLVESGKLSLDTKVFPLLALPREHKTTTHFDERINQITVRNLLQCTAGWDRKSAGDPMFAPQVCEAAELYSNNLRPSPKSIIRYELNRTLDFDPGTHFAYSNVCYSVLGLLIKKVSGTDYAVFLQREIFAPLGLKSPQPGKTRERAQGEVKYYTCAESGLRKSILPNVKGMISEAYGSDFYLEALTADCGWIANTEDVARFVSTALGERADCPIKKETIAIMLERPPIQYWQGKNNYFAMGWEVENSLVQGERILKKMGCLPGNTAAAIHGSDGTTIVVAFNSRPSLAESFESHLDTLLKGLLNNHPNWK